MRAEPPTAAGFAEVAGVADTADRIADLAARVARLGGALRARGVRVGLSDEADGLEALTFFDAADRDDRHTRDDARRALAVALKIRPQGRAVFEELFAELWGEPQAEPAARSERRLAVEAPARRRQATHREPVAAPPGSDPGSPAGEDIGYSPDAVLRRKSFDECSAAELVAMERLLARLALRLATRRSRRLTPTRGRGVADLRRSFRRAVQHGGELFSLARRARAIEEPHLVLLCDTSGSMDPHARFLLAFVLALGRVARHSEVFAFNTALVRLTPWLRQRRLRPEGIARTLARLADEVPDWSGGTRIGECLREFATRYLRSLVDRRTVVLILSDGLDRGDIEPVAQAMRELRQRARGVLWLNPLAGDARYQPTARAMAAALPYVDRLLPAHNLESLERLMPHLFA